MHAFLFHVIHPHTSYSKRHIRTGSRFPVNSAGGSGALPYWNPESRVHTSSHMEHIHALET